MPVIRITGVRRPAYCGCPIPWAVVLDYTQRRKSAKQGHSLSTVGATEPAVSTSRYDDLLIMMDPWNCEPK